MKRPAKCDRIQVKLCSTQQAWGGGEVYLSTLCRKLMPEVPVELLARKGSKLEAFAQQNAIPFQTVEGKGRSPIQIWQLRRWLCQSDQPTILHCNDSHALTSVGTAALALGHVRVVAMRHTMFPIRSVAKYHCLADQVICVSNAVADACAESGISRSMLEVVHSAIDRPQPDLQKVKMLRSELLESEWQKLIVAVGNLHDCKGYDSLLDAAALLSADHNFRIVIAGEGPQRQHLERRIAQLDLQSTVKLLGFRDDANELMSAADLVVHPAHDEGLCLTVAAAMMLGRPVLASAVGGLKDVLAIDQRMNCAEGPFSLPLQPGKPHQLAEAIDSQLSGSPRPEQLESARQFAITRFNSDRMAEKTLSVYRQLTEGLRAAA